MTINKKQILEALGVEPVEDRFWLGLLLGVGVGAMLGGVASMLLAPRSGPELRETLRQQGADLAQRVRARVQNGDGKATARGDTDGTTR